MKKRSKALKRSRKNPDKPKTTASKKNQIINKTIPPAVPILKSKKQSIKFNSKKTKDKNRKPKKIANQKGKIPKSHLFYVLISLIGTVLLITAIIKQNESLLFLGLGIAIITACISGIIAIRKVKSNKLIKPKKEERKILKALLNFLTSPIPYSLVSISILVYSFIRQRKILFWTGLVLLILSILLLFTKKVRHRNLRLNNIKEEINAKHEKYETDLDKLYRVLQKNKAIKFSDISKTFSIDMKKVEEWSKIMEDSELAEIHYPAIGEPQLSIRSAAIIQEFA